jgi:hypothetical protein
MYDDPGHAAGREKQLPAQLCDPSVHRHEKSLWTLRSVARRTMQVWTDFFGDAGCLLPISHSADRIDRSVYVNNSLPHACIMSDLHQELTNI